jgi:nitrogen-specific signal transduction histidine kinase
MAWQPSVYLLPLAFAACVSVVLGVFVRRRSDALARTFAALMFGIGVWALAATLEFAVTGVDAQLFWNRVSYVGAVVVPAAWLLLMLEYAGYGEWVTRRTVAALSVEPVVVVALVWTNGLHGLMWRDVSQVTVSGVVVMAESFGPGYWLNLGYSYVLVIVGLVLLAGVLVRSNPVYRRQSAVLMAGAVVPLGANAAFNFGVTPVPVDATPFTFALTGTLFAFALFYFDLLDLEHVARDALVSEMENPVVMVNADGVVVDANDAAHSLFPGLEAGGPVPPALRDGSGAVSDSELSVSFDGGSRTYRVRTTPLRDHRDVLVGSLVVLDDVTELRRHEQRLTVLNRVLRHNVRNELSVVLGHLDAVADQLADGDAEASLATAREHARRVVELSDQARTVVETLHRGAADPVAVDAGAVVAAVADRARGRFPAATVESSAESARALVAADDLLDVAVSNLVENAVEHNDAAEPTVRVECASDPDCVRVTVADDGPGIPEVERTVLTEGDETPLEHGSGLGLWLVHWIVTASDGDLSFDENDPRGSVVTMRLPRADDERDDASRG